MRRFIWTLVAAWAVSIPAWSQDMLRALSEPQRCFERADVIRDAVFPPPLKREELQAVLDKAAEGDPESEYCAGKILFSLRTALTHLDIDSAQAEHQAAAWYRKAADQNHAEATNELAGLHLFGWGVPKDNAEYCRLKVLAAQLGSVDAQLSLARNHLSGECRAAGVEVDTAKALKLLSSAALGGNDEALYWLGDFLYDGEYGDGGLWATITPDLPASAFWRRKCATECSFLWRSMALRIPLMVITDSGLMVISSERSDAGGFMIPEVIGMGQG